MTGTIEWGQNQNPKKSLDQNLTPKKSLAEFPSHKNVQKALNYITRKTETLVLNTPKNTYLIKSGYPKKIPSKIFLPKKILKSKISNPKKSFDHPCHLKSEGHPGDTSRPCLHVNLQMTNDGSVITSVFDVLLILVNAVFFSKDELHLPVEVTHGYVGKLFIRQEHR